MQISMLYLLILKVLSQKNYENHSKFLMKKTTLFENIFVQFFRINMYYNIFSNDQFLFSSVEEYSQNIISDKYGTSYVFSIAVADLDSKSLNKVEKVYNDFISMLKLIDIEHEFK